MFKNKWLVGAALAGLLAVSGAAQAASVSFVQPADGATVSNPVHVVFGVDGMKIAPAGSLSWVALIYQPAAEYGCGVPILTLPSSSRTDDCHWLG